MRQPLIALVAALSTPLSQPARALADDIDPYVMFGLNIMVDFEQESALGLGFELRVFKLIEVDGATETSLGGHASFAWFNNGGQLALGVDYSAQGDDSRVLGLQLGLFHRLYDKRPNRTGVALGGYVGAYRAVEVGLAFGLDLEAELLSQLRFGLFYPGRICERCSDSIE